MFSLSRPANFSFKLTFVLFASLLFVSFSLSAPQPPQTTTSMIPELKSRADSGDPSARRELVNFLISADPASPGYDLAVSWLSSNASQNAADAQFLLGFLYQHGKGVPRDFRKAADNYRLAALQGYPLAENNLGILYHNGDGVPRDRALAFNWFRSAALHGNLSAQLSLGVYYHEGYATPIDYVVAAKWFRVAADRGFAPAQSCLAFCYHQGIGVPHDNAQAAHWARRAAEQGHAPAEVLLGYLYEHGEGLPLDYIAAYTWFSLASAAGEKSSVDRLNSLSQIMSRKQLDKANSLVSAQSLPPQRDSGSSDTTSLSLFADP